MTVLLTLRADWLIPRRVLDAVANIKLLRRRERFSTFALGGCVLVPGPVPVPLVADFLTADSFEVGVLVLLAEAVGPALAPVAPRLLPAVGRCGCCGRVADVTALPLSPDVVENPDEVDDMEILSGSGWRLPPCSWDWSDSKPSSLMVLNVDDFLVS